MGNCFSVDKENDEQIIVPKAQPPGNYPGPTAVADPPSIRPRRPVKKRPQQKQTEQSEKESSIQIKAKETPTFPENARSDVMAGGPLPKQAPVTPSKSTEDNETKKPQTEIDKVKLETKAKVSSIYENSKKMAPEVNAFSGSKKSKEYFNLDETLMKNIDQLDRIDFSNDPELKEFIKEAIKYTQSLLTLLDSKLTD